MPAIAAIPPSKSAASAADNAFFRPSGQKIQANLEMLLGATIALKFEGVRRFTREEAQGLAPENAAIVVGGLGTGPDGEALILRDRSLALLLSNLLQMLPEAAIKSRLGELGPGDLSDPERESVGEIGNFMVAAVGERLRDLGGAAYKLTQTPTRFLSGPDAATAAAAIAAEGYLGVVGSMKAGSFDEFFVAVLLADSIGATAAPTMYEAPSESSGDGPAADAAETADTEGGRPAAAAGGAGTAPQSTARAPGKPAVARKGRPGEPGPGASRASSIGTTSSDAAGAVVDCTGRTAGFAVSGPVATRLAALLPPGAVATVWSGLGAAYDVLEAGSPPSLVIVEVGADREHLLDLGGVLRRHPSASKTAFLVLLARPTRRNVMRCATSGFFDVLPVDTDDDGLQRRLADLLRPVAD